MKNRELTFVIAGLLAAAAVPASMLVLFILVTRPSRTVSTDIVPVLVLASQGYVYSCLAAALLGFPAFLVFRRYGLVRWWSSSLAGLAAGVALGSLFSGPQIQWQAVVIWNVAGA